MSNSYSGSIQKWFQKDDELTDAAPTVVIKLPNVTDVGSLLIDVTSDKGCTVDLARYMDSAKTVAGVPGTQGVVADGGPSGAFIYEDLGAVACVLTVTKTEAGTSAGFAVTVRGQSS